jgi:hypothetical protein
LVVPVQIGSLEVVMDFRHYFVPLQILYFSDQFEEISAIVQL